jgi:hypothetical protein
VLKSVAAHDFIQFPASLFVINLKAMPFFFGKRHRFLLLANVFSALIGIY